MPSLLGVFLLYGNDNNARLRPDITPNKTHTQKSNADVIVANCCVRPEVSRTVIGSFCLLTLFLKLKTKLKNPEESCFINKSKLHTVFIFLTKLFI